MQPAAVRVSTVVRVGAMDACILGWPWRGSASWLWPGTLAVRSRTSWSSFPAPLQHPPIRGPEIPQGDPKANPAIQNGMGQEELSRLVHPVHDLPVHPVLLLPRNSLGSKAKDDGAERNRGHTAPNRDRRPPRTPPPGPCPHAAGSGPGSLRLRNTATRTRASETETGGPGTPRSP